MHTGERFKSLACLVGQIDIESSVTRTLANAKLLGRGPHRLKNLAIGRQGRVGEMF
jgi:hypothetical protein